MEPTESPGRPWAQGIGLVLLGLAVAAFANGVVLASDPGPALRALGMIGYLLGVAITGAGVHRILWVEPAGRRRSTRLLVTAIVTVPVFAAMAVVLSLLLTILQRRFTM